jgi:hypothetical protein
VQPSRPARANGWKSNLCLAAPVVIVVLLIRFLRGLIGGAGQNRSPRSWLRAVDASIGHFVFVFNHSAVPPALPLALAFHAVSSEIPSSDDKKSEKTLARSGETNE